MALNEPPEITGGCLCGAIRYAISYSDQHSWPPMVATCQCSFCRKWTGTLLSTDLIIKKTQLSPDLSTFQSFNQYQSSPGHTRAFCAKCGSSIAWYSDDMPDDLIILVGTIDAEYLVGTVRKDTVKETEHGTEFERTSSYGKELTDPSKAGNLYWQNTIPGVTDNVRGPKFLQHFFGKKPLPESVSH